MDHLPRSSSGVWVLALLACACGTNRPDIPEYLLADDAGNTAGYPSGPYAKDIKGDIGLVLGDLSFQQGWLDPKTAGYDTAKLAPISLSDFYDPDGSKGNEILLFNTAAGWCGACKNEHEGTGTNPSLGEHAASLAPRGFRVLSVLFEDGNFNPAQEKHLVAWAKSYETNFPFALDPENQLGGTFGVDQTAPLNLVVDAKTMKVLFGTTGDKGAVIWPFIETELEKRGK
ncbi:MAG: TlpA family protein disulfide reductase [Myxococcales bacterium]|nr:TlpA family protein disulfide reductase [Myxococcales bacterium]